LHLLLHGSPRLSRKTTARCVTNIPYHCWTHAFIRTSYLRARQVHIRLTDQGRHYSESLEKLRDNVRKYDDSGRRLFTPAINREPASAHKPTPASEQVAATESGSRRQESDDVLQDAADTPPPPPPPAAATKKLPPHPAHSSTAAAAAPAAAADEFLYQDARDREERYRMRERELQSQIEARAAASKMNASSMTLLRRKAVRTFLDRHGAEVFEYVFHF
jgi:hypothetical protein